MIHAADLDFLPMTVRVRASLDRAGSAPGVAWPGTHICGAVVAIVLCIPEDGGMPFWDGPVLPLAPLDANRPALPVKLRDLPADSVRPAVPAAEAEPKAGAQDPATVVEPRGPEADEAVRAIPAPRERFGHYVVLHQIGEGAMGVVLAAYDQHLDRKVALKLPPAAPPRTRGQLHFVQARALRAVDDRSRALTVAEEAIADYEAAGPGFAGQVADIRAWIADPSAP